MILFRVSYFVLRIYTLYGGAPHAPLKRASSKPLPLGEASLLYCSLFAYKMQGKTVRVQGSTFRVAFVLAFTNLTPNLALLRRARTFEPMNGYKKLNLIYIL